MSQYAYDQDSRPAFPMIEIAIANPFSHRATASLPARVDTGADMTIIPHRLGTLLGLTPFGRVLVQGFHGPPEIARTYPADVTVNGHTIEFVELVLEGAFSHWGSAGLNPRAERAKPLRGWILARRAWLFQPEHSCSGLLPQSLNTPVLDETAEDEVLVGRDVLNELVLILNGPRAVVEVIEADFIPGQPDTP